MSESIETIEQAMLAARHAGVDRLDIQVMLSTLLGQSRSWLLAHDRDPLPSAVQPTLKDWIHRRAEGEPLAYLLGEKEFFGLTFGVNPGVLIPRPDTEVLVEWALEHTPVDQHRDVLDLGTGSGAIALAIAHLRPLASVTAVDASAAALETARTNAERLGVSVQFRLGSWLEPVGADTFDLIVSNPPYIAEGDAHLPALKHEPITALTSGADGLDDIRHIVAQAKAHLRPGGWLLLEHGYDQADAITQLLQEAGYSQVTTRRDLGGQNRCTGGQTL